MNDLFPPPAATAIDSWALVQLQTTSSTLVAVDETLLPTLQQPRYRYRCLLWEIASRIA
ncbi:uncharacterized protein BO97DRAFT_405592 [Aspergillus homomorphus CBS 101889]|uniref:Uncharacterized protein n=1 Tax=Aspergillus homomorphus (strain CBS 101889) TaxID=1450537 RepID=A0A395HWF6_ASPHC|nr:hypothetical protein BO97DRAFT_405592 [Aspergillus homomorphus CBS 101889]RAL12242.1 hypothetical protein BO97DRAFT_405592 [Aspergillus homomorphus CBS 101889]